jgi:hypothetical protein
MYVATASRFQHNAEVTIILETAGDGERVERAESGLAKGA